MELENIKPREMNLENNLYLNFTDDIIEFLKNNIKYNLSQPFSAFQKKFKENYNSDIRHLYNKKLEINKFKVIIINNNNSILLFLLNYETTNYKLPEDVYKKCLKNYIDNMVEPKQDLNVKINNNKLEDLTYIIYLLIKKNNKNIFEFLYLQLDKYGILFKLNNYLNLKKTCEYIEKYNIINHALLYSIDIVYLLYKKYDINLISYLNNHIKLKLKFYKQYSIHSIHSIHGIHYKNKLYDPLIEIINNELIIHNNILIDNFNNCLYAYNKYENFIEFIIVKTNNIELYNKYIENLINNLMFYKIQNFIKCRTLYLKYINWGTILGNLCEFKYESYNNTCVQFNNNYIKIWEELFPYITKYLHNNVIDNIIKESYINSIITIKNSHRIIKLINKYIDWNKLDQGDFTPFMDGLRYSSKDTIKFILENNEDINLNFYSFDNNNVITCALYNSDERVIKILLEYLYNKGSLKNLLVHNNNHNKYIEALQTNLNNTIHNNFRHFKTKFITFIHYIDKIINRIDGVNELDNEYEKETLINTKIYIINIFLNNNFNNIKICNFILNNYKKILDIKFLSVKTSSILCNRFSIHNIKVYKKLIESYILTKPLDYFKLLLIVNSVGCYKNTKELLLYIINNINIISDCDKNNSNIITTKEHSSIFIQLHSNQKRCNCKNKLEILNDDQLNDFIQLYKSFLLKFNMNNKGNIENIEIIKHHYIYIFNINNIDILFKNGIYPAKTNYKNYDQYISLLINEKKNYIKNNKGTNNSNSYNPFIRLINWEISILVIKKYIEKKYNKNLEIFKTNIKNTNFFIDRNLELELINNNFINFKRKNPQHIKPEHFYFNKLNKTHIYLTQKADGIYKKGLNNIYPDLHPALHPDLQQEINAQNIEYEYISKYNLCMVFGYSNLINNYKFIQIIREMHFAVPDIDLSNFSFENLEKYKKLERNALYNYIKNNMKKNKRLWWPKLIWKLDYKYNESNEYNEYIKTIDTISNTKIDFFPTDGWILYSKNTEDEIYKIKPYEKLTIDLLFIEDRFITSDNYEYKVIQTNNYINNGIYRCYFNNTELLWEPREIRNDKKNPNNNEICSYIDKCHKNKWNLNDLVFLVPYYHNLFEQKMLQFQLHNNKKSDYFKNILSAIMQYDNIDYRGNIDILDIGCGFRGNNKHLKKICFNNKNISYTGLDIDYKILINENIIDNKNLQDNNNLYIADSRELWNIDSQLKIFNTPYNFIPNIKDFYNKFENSKFDIIMALNSIHYFIESDKSWENFMTNINNYSKKKTLLVIRYLDNKLLDEIFKSNKIIHYKSSYVRKIDDFNKNKNNINTISNYRIRIYYEWCHNKPIEEYVLNYDSIVNLLKEHGWHLHNMNNSKNINNINNINKQSDMNIWNNYLNCFKNFVFIKK